MYMNCECGKTIMKKSYWRHLKTLYHKSRINNNTESLDR